MRSGQITSVTQTPAYHNIFKVAVLLQQVYYCHKYLVGLTQVGLNLTPGQSFLVNDIYFSLLKMSDDIITTKWQ